MDDKIRKSCPNCCQLYQIKPHSSGVIGNLPLFLPCKHTICESCIRSLTKFQEPITCKICLQTMEIKPSDVLLIAQDKGNVYDMFPVNIHVLGELTLQLVVDVHNTSKPPEECFIDINSILMETDENQEKCMECHNRTSKMCKQCDTALCDTCFNKSHKNFIIFKNHALQKIAPAAENLNNCTIHDNKKLEYYCTDCSKAVCMDCLFVGSDKSCKDHNLKSTTEINDSHIEELMNIQPKVDETFRRLTKTAVDIGQLLFNIENGSGSSSDITQIITSIEQHFSQLCAVVQKHKKETIELAIKVKSAEIESLLKAKNDVFEALKKSKKIMNIISSAADSTKFKQMNLSTLLEDAKKMIEIPWFLLKKEADESNKIKITVNEDLNGLISDYIHLEGNAAVAYELRSSSELEAGAAPPPPPAPVLPPQLPKDVRQMQKPKAEKSKPKEDFAKPFTFCRNAPSYRSKSASVNSLNSSIDSDSYKWNYNEQEDSSTHHNGTHNKTHMQGQEPRRPLVEGSQELVYISHILDPHNFYVQRACDQKVVKNILDEYRNSVSGPKPQLNNITEGKIYLAFNKADNLWQRCRVLRVDKKNKDQPRIVVYCFDFGSTETVQINDLRLLPPARWNSPPPLAAACALANCEPVNGEWMNDDSILIQKIIDNKQAVIHVRRVLDTVSGGKLECDVTTFEDKVSLAHAFVFHGRAKMPDPRLRYPILNTIGDTPKIFTSTSDFKPNSIDEIYFTHIVSPDKFYVRKKQHQRDFLRLSEELRQEYKLWSDTGKVYLPEIGTAYVVNTEKYRKTADTKILGEESPWARCVVTEMAMRGRVRVLLVDSGLHLLVHWTALRAILARFTTLRALATECHLAGITAANRTWCPASVALLKRYQNHLLEMRVEQRARGAVPVALFDRTDEENVVCLNHEMVQFKFAITIGMFKFSRNSEDLKDQCFTYKSPFDKQARKPKAKPKITILKKEEEPKEIEEEDLVAKDKGPLRLEAKILNYISPSIIYLTLVHQETTFSEMFDNLKKYYTENKTEEEVNWHVGDRCCTICIQSQTWRRASILELNGDTAKVFYSDFAIVEAVPTSSLRNLVPEFASIGVAAIKCHLSGVMPAIGEEWPSITKEFLKELLDAYNRFFITKSGNFIEKSMPVEIWVYHTIEGGALEPDISEWRCLNKKIIEQGLGIPIKSEQLNSTEANKQETEGEEVLSFLNVTGHVSEWLQLEPMPTKPLAVPDVSASGSEAADDEEPDASNSNSIFISEWMPPEPFSSDEFTASPTFIDNDGIIYLHEASQSETFDLIRAALGVRYHSADPKARYVRWAAGEPCVALYHYDNTYYRARVLDVNRATATCLVHYIDYGNEEICSFANMRKSIALYEIPIQAHKCVFSRIQPAGSRWEREALDYIHKLLVEKQCFVKVAGKTVDGVTPIELKYNKLWINDHLVDLELAKYVDGAKPVQRRGNVMSIVEKEPVDRSHNTETDSGPDFIVENDPNLTVDDEIGSEISNDDRSEIDSKGIDWRLLEAKDWNLLVAEDNEDNDSITGKYITFPKQIEEEFMCDIVHINHIKVFPLTIIKDAEVRLMYDEMFHEIEEEGGNMPPLNGIFANKACITLFAEDNKWYRAMITDYNEAEKMIKVRYVDYGNTELISVDNAREIIEEWVTLPPLTVFAKLHGINVNPEFDIKQITKEYSEVFEDRGPFNAKIIESDEFTPTVELRYANDELVSDKLVEKGVFVKVCP